MGTILQVVTCVMKKQHFLSASGVENNPFPVVAEEQMSLARISPPAMLFVLCSATCFVSLVISVFQEMQAADSCDFSLRRAIAFLSLSEVCWNASFIDVIMSSSVCNWTLSCVSFT